MWISTLFEKVNHDLVLLYVSSTPHTDLLIEMSSGCSWLVKIHTITINCVFNCASIHFVVPITLNQNWPHIGTIGCYRKPLGCFDHTCCSPSFTFYLSIPSLAWTQIKIPCGIYLWASREAVLYHQHSILDSRVAEFPMFRNFNYAGFSTL